MELEKEILGMDHAELGALYLKSNVCGHFCASCQFHHHPDAVRGHSRTVAAVQVADMMIRPPDRRQRQPCRGGRGRWMASAGWEILFAGQSEGEQTIAIASLSRSLARIPAILESLL